MASCQTLRILQVSLTVRRSQVRCLEANERDFCQNTGLVDMMYLYVNEELYTAIVEEWLLYYVPVEDSNITVKLRRGVAISRGSR